MSIEELLKGKLDCNCGQVHTCDIKNVIIESGAVNQLGKLCDSYRHILLVADCNTYKTCGDRVVQILADRLQNKLIFECTGFLIPNEEAVSETEKLIKEDTDLMIGIGSGVINDLCKYVSFCKKLPYYILATAPSMDGYASKGAAMITDNMKVTYNTHVPTAIIGDIDILKDAPMAMIQSGFGDIIGKYSALNDWKLAALVNGEHFCEYVYQLTFDALKNTESLADGILKRDPESIKALTEALVIVGIAMSYVGNSRPASGSEHHFSHYFEITGILNHRDYFCHGTDVAYSTVQTALMRKRILEFKEYPENTMPFDREKWIENINRIYKSSAKSVIELQDKCGYYAEDYSAVYKEKWQEIRRILAEVPSPQELMEILETAGLDFSEFNRFYGTIAINDGTFYAKDLKDRYTFLWIYFQMFCKYNRTFTNDYRLMIAGHRGFRGTGDCAYENTMKAFMEAVEAGVDMIETDVRCTKDNVLVLIHDEAVDRTTDSTGLVADFTYEELKKINAGTENCFCPIPTFREFLEYISGKHVTLNLEFKVYSDKKESCEYCIDEALKLCEEYGMGDKLICNSFDAYILEYINRKYKGRYLLHGYYPYSIMKNVTENPDDYLYCACIFDDLDIANYDYLVKHNIEPWIGAGVKEKEHLKQCIRLGARLVTTDNPKMTLEQLK